jgi:hypothetical protein
MIELTPQECTHMIDTKRCKGNHMECTNKICSFKGEPIHKFNYLITHRETGYNCIIKTRKIIARTEESIVFNENCKAKDLSCKTTNSMIIWSRNTIRKCAYQQVTILHNITIEHDKLTAT